MAVRRSSLTPQFEFDDATGQYRAITGPNKGRFVPQTTVRAVLDSYLTKKSEIVRSLAEQLQRREISIADWQREMEREVRLIHSVSAAAAKGGWAQMTPSDWGRIGPLVREELSGRKGVHGGLRGFALAIENGLPLDGRFLQRAMQYSEAGRHTFESIREQEMRSIGMTQMRSVRHASDSCPGCLEEALRGWQLIGELSLPGTRDCLRRCRCTIEYRNRETPSTVSLELTPDQIKQEMVDRLAPARPHPFMPTGRPVKEALHLPPELEHLRYAMDAQADVHGDGNLDILQVRVMRGPVTNKNFLAGEYIVGEQPTMGMHPQGPTPGLSFLHENGHWLHDQAIAKVDTTYGGRPRVVKEDLQWVPNMEGIKKAIKKSSEVKLLESYQKKAAQGKTFSSPELRPRPFQKARRLNYVIDGKHVDYLLTDRELFARAYSQYVAVRSGDSQLLRELAARRFFADHTAVGGGSEKNGLHYFEQWSPDSFEPIAEEIDKLFLDLGWIAKR